MISISDKEYGKLNIKFYIIAVFNVSLLVWLWLSKAKKVNLKVKILKNMPKIVVNKSEFLLESDDMKSKSKDTLVVFI